MSKIFATLSVLIILSTPIFAKGYDVVSIGMYDIEKWDVEGEQSDEAYSYRYERRFDNSLFEVGPENEDFRKSDARQWSRI